MFILETNWALNWKLNIENVLPDIEVSGEVVGLPTFAINC